MMSILDQTCFCKRFLEHFLTDAKDQFYLKGFPLL
jgi:hypothetical protein